MSKVIEEAKEYLKNKDAYSAVGLIKNLISELESKNKEIERLEAVVDISKWAVNHYGIVKTDGVFDEMRKALSNLKEQG